TATLTIEKADPSLDGLQINFVNDYDPGMSKEVFIERLDAKKYYLEDYSVVLHSGVNTITVTYKLGTNYNDVTLEVTLTCNAQISGFTLADGGRQISGRDFDKGNIIVSYQYNDGTSKVVSADFTASTVSSTTTQFSVDVTITDSSYKLDEKTKTVSITPIAAPQVMIYAVYGAGGLTNATYQNDFVILYNPTDADVDLTNWSIQVASATATSGDSNKVATLNGTIHAYGFYIILGSSGNNVGEAALPFASNADCSASNIDPAQSNFQLFLSTTSTRLSPITYANGSYVDMIGAGTATSKEGSTAAPAPSKTTYIRRKALQDTDDNSADFEVIDFNGTTDFDFLKEGHRVYNYAKTVLDNQNLNFNSLPDSFTLPMSFEGTAINWSTQNADNLSIAADGTVTVNKTVECDGKLIGTIAGYPLGFEFNVFISNKTRLDAPQVSLEHFTLTWTSVSNAASYDIYIDGVMYTNTTALTYDLYDSNFASNFSNIKSYAITVVAKCAVGSADYVDSLASSVVALNFADTSDLSALDTNLVYTFAVSVTSKGVWSQYNNVNFFVVDSITSQGFLVYRYTNQDIFSSLVFGS
ncbi:MAG: lamin tail domain-containing protein, partial [Anaeroplasmataceae bacterium]|nr:lamin tail domain-containing protein [Anaeroplasmataceae bacterium]